MHRKNLVAVFALLFAFVPLSAHAGTAAPKDPPSDLVLVLNTNPANRLGGEIWLMNLNGRLVRRITSNHYHEEYPSFSPDGTKIAFVRNMGGVARERGLDPKNNEIFVYDLRADTETRLTHNSVEDGRPEWSFDGGLIAFHSGRGRPDDKTTLWAMAADGSNSTRITTLQSGDLSHSHPSWAPDGQWLAFVSCREENGYRYTRVEKVRRDGSQRTVVSSGGKYLKNDGGGGALLGDLEPVHSPDGTMIWAARRLGDGRARLFSFGAGTYYGGKAEIDMSGRGYPEVMIGEESPRFSPDGRRLLLTGRLRGAGKENRRVLLTDPQSSFRRYLTSREDWDAWHPSWHPLAHSGAEPEDAGKVSRYQADLVKSRTLPGNDGAGRSVNPRQRSSAVLRSEEKATIEPVVMEMSPAAIYEARWKLDRPPAEVFSLTFRCEGEFPGAAKGHRPSVLFQLMDWDINDWVTVMARSESPPCAAGSTHEVAPANFISDGGREVALRVLMTGTFPDVPAGWEARDLTLEVKHR